ncbi:MAG: DUF2946 domain-containing protein [Burkholderiaceae bacterium]|nr:DUF2946 domain-containing protein [Burkholderiaceae bacterium]
MNILRPHLRPVTWLALVAVLALALMPTLSHALAFARGDAVAWAEVCTPQGIKVVALDGADADAPATPVSTGQHLEHCPFCKLGSDDALPLPPALPAMAEPLPPGPFLPPLALQAPRTLHAWAAAQPRAPPTVA